MLRLWVRFLTIRYAADVQTFLTFVLGHLIGALAQIKREANVKSVSIHSPIALQLSWHTSSSIVSVVAHRHLACSRKGRPVPVMRGGLVTSIGIECSDLRPECFDNVAITLFSILSFVQRNGRISGSTRAFDETYRAGSAAAAVASGALLRRTDVSST